MFLEFCKYNISFASGYNLCSLFYQVLSIIDSSYHVLNDLKRLHVPQLKDNRKQSQDHESFVNYKEKVSVDIPFLGVSLMNSHTEVPILETDSFASQFFWS